MLVVAQPTAMVKYDRVTFEGRSFSPPVYYGYRVSLFPSARRPVGIEAEMIHLKVYAADLPQDGILKSFAMSHGLNLLLTNLAGRWTLAWSGDVPRVQALARVGIGPTLPHAESNINGIEYGRYEWGGPVSQLSGALTYRAARRFAVNLEYKLTRTAQSVSVPGGTATGTFVSHHAVVGAAWHSR
jgi:hypothetical protein